nr:MAG TPA: hypothetical protein [Caudoviricetes sp.]
MFNYSTYILDLKWSRIYALLKRSKTKASECCNIHSIFNHPSEEVICLKLLQLKL